MAFITFQPSDYFNTKLYTGTGSSNAQTGVGFQPDWLWIKDRSSSSNSHVITDAIRGTNKIIFSDNDGAETTDANRVTSFDSDGFTVGTDGSTNTNSNNYVAWNWKANGAGSTNTDGNMNTTVTTSANTTSGVSVITWTGSGNTTYNTIGHGLGVAPKMFWVKNLTNSADWIVYHASLGATKYLKLNTSVGEASATDAWNDTAPTSSLITLGSADTTNGTGKSMVAYAFAEKKGFSKFGSYTGNGNADGPFIHTDFKPGFFMYKLSSASGQNWTIQDNKRIGYNPVGHLLHPDLSNAESNQQSGSLYVSDFCSNGIKIRGTDTNINGSGNTYIYMIFAEEPLVSSNDVPATAR